MKFLKLFKKEDTLASLALDCHTQYQKFCSKISDTKFPSYTHFKYLIQKDFIYLKDRISITENSEIAFLLLKHLKNQLVFINKNSFHLTYLQLFSFISVYYPYNEVIEKIISSKEVPIISC